MKKILIFLFLSISINMFAIIPGEYTFTLDNPSANGLALGGTCTGADIWNRNPLDVWSNPAKLGYYKGLSLGYSHNDYVEEVFSGIYWDNSYITFGWKGIGIMLPMINNFSKLGSSFDYGMQDMYNEDGVITGRINTWQQYKEFALGLNVLEYYSSLKKDFELAEYQPFVDFSIGYNYNFISDHTPMNMNNDYEIPTIKNHTDGLGMILRISPLNEKNFMKYNYFNTDIVFSLYYRNLSKTKTSLHHYTEPICYSTDTSAAIKVGLGFESIKDNIDPELAADLSTLCQDIIAVKYYIGNSHFGDRVWESSNGLELTLLDLVSFRWGSYDDENVFDDSFGIGINLHYHDLVQLQYNYTEYPESGLISDQDISDYMININLLDLLKRLNN